MERETLKTRMRVLEQQALEEALILNRGNLTKTAHDLDVSLKTVHNKIREFNFLAAWLEWLRAKAILERGGTLKSKRKLDLLNVKSAEQVVETV